MDDSKNNPTFFVGSLTLDEILLLDGKCNPDIQKKINVAKRAQENILKYSDLTPLEATFVGNLVNEATTNGILVFSHRNIDACPVCNKIAGYAKYSRTSKYHRKGDTNHSKPLSFRGFEFAKRFVSFKGSVTIGCCKDCWEKLKNIIIEQVKDIKAEINIPGITSKFKRYDRRKCKECGWEGGKNEMGMLPALMGGKYPGICPKCKAKSNFLDPSIFEIADGFELIEIKKE